MIDHDDRNLVQPVASDGTGALAEFVLPLHAERLNVATRVRQTGEVTVRVDTETSEQLVDIPLSVRRVDVERRAVGVVVDDLPETRREGRTTIVPVVEEIVVTRFRIVEEIRITEIDETQRHRELVRLRSEKATILRAGKTT